MREVAPSSSRPLAYDWDHRYETQEADKPGLLVLDHGEAKPLTQAELARGGPLGRIVTAGTIPAQRTPPVEEQIQSIPPDKNTPQAAVPDPSIYLG